MEIEHAVARAVTRVQALSRAVHSREPWYLDVAGATFLADRELRSSGVVFRSVVPPHPHGMVYLMEGDNIVLCVGETGATDVETAFEYELILRDGVAV
jgi:hypothetical protein